MAFRGKERGKMKDSEKIRILDDEIMNLEIIHERIKLMGDNIDQDYFSLNDDYCKLHYFDKAKIESDIISDYVSQMSDRLKKIRRMLREWKGVKEEKAN